MAMIEIEELSTLQEIGEFMATGNLKALMDKYFDEEPTNEFDNDLNELYIKFHKYPFSVIIPNYVGEISMFVKFNSDSLNDLRILKFIDKNTKIDEVISKIGSPDFSRDRLDDKTNKMIKYFIGKFSLAIDYDENKIIMISIFEDKYR
jgi:hypothetical protein